MRNSPCPLSESRVEAVRMRMPVLMRRISIRASGGRGGAVVGGRRGCSALWPTTE